MPQLLLHAHLEYQSRFNFIRYVNKPVYKTKKKSSDNFREQLHFGGDRHSFAIFCKSKQVQYLKKFTFLHSVSVNKIVLEYTIYSIKKHKKSIWVRSGFHLEKLAKSYTNRNKSNI